MNISRQPGTRVVARAERIVLRAAKRQRTELAREIADFHSARDGVEIDLMIERSGEMGRSLQALRNLASVPRA